MYAIMCDLGYIKVGLNDRQYSFTKTLREATLFSQENYAQKFINKNPEIYKHSPSIVEAIKY